MWHIAQMKDGLKLSVTGINDEDSRKATCVFQPDASEGKGMDKEHLCAQVMHWLSLSKKRQAVRCALTRLGLSKNKMPWEPGLTELIWSECLTKQHWPKFIYVVSEFLFLDHTMEYLTDHDIIRRHAVASETLTIWCFWCFQKAPNVMEARFFHASMHWPHDSKLSTRGFMCQV